MQPVQQREVSDRIDLELIRSSSKICRRVQRGGTCRGPFADAFEQPAAFAREGTPRFLLQLHAQICRQFQT